MRPLACLVVAAGLVLSTLPASGAHSHGPVDLSRVQRVATGLQASGKADELEKLLAQTVDPHLNAFESHALSVQLCRLLQSVKDEARLAKAVNLWCEAAVDPKTAATDAAQLHSLAAILHQRSDAERLAAIAKAAQAFLKSDSQGGCSIRELMLLEEIAQWAKSDALRDDVRKLTASAAMADGQFQALAPLEMQQLARLLKTTGQDDQLQRLNAFLATDYLARPGLAEALRSVEWHMLLGVLDGSSDNQAALAKSVLPLVLSGDIDVRLWSHETLLLLLSAVKASSDSDNGRSMVFQWIGQAPDACPRDQQRHVVKAVFSGPADVQRLADSWLAALREGKATAQQAALALALAAKAPPAKDDKAQRPAILAAAAKLDASPEFVEPLAQYLEKAGGPLSNEESAMLAGIVSKLDGYSSRLPFDAYKTLSRLLRDHPAVSTPAAFDAEIGRASCRERV